jgi:hypothetical protein
MLRFHGLPDGILTTMLGITGLPDGILTRLMAS